MKHKRIPTPKTKTDLLFDETVKFFAWVVKTNPRVSDVVRYYKKMNLLGRFEAKDIFLASFEAGYNQSVFAAKLLAQGKKLDRNFERNVMRFRKKCGMAPVKSAEQLRKEINHAVAREVGNPVTFVACGPNCVIRTTPKLNEAERQAHIRSLKGKYKDILPSSKQFIKDKEKEIKLEDKR